MNAEADSTYATMIGKASSTASSPATSSTMSPPPIDSAMRMEEEDHLRQELTSALAIQLCAVVRCEARFTSSTQISAQGIPSNAISVSALSPAYSKKFHQRVLPDIVRGLRLGKLSVLLRDGRLNGCVALQNDEANNQLMIWPRTRGPCACARDLTRRVRANSDETWEAMWEAESVGRASRDLDRRMWSRSPKDPSPSGSCVPCGAPPEAGLRPKTLLDRFDEAEAGDEGEVGGFSFFLSAPCLRAEQPAPAFAQYKLWSSPTPFGLRPLSAMHRAGAAGSPAERRAAALGRA